MERRVLRLASSLAAVVFAAACAQNPESPTSPSASGGSTATHPGGSNLKVTAPTPMSPVDGAVADSVRPTVVFGNASGRFTSVALGYRVQVFDAAGAAIAELSVAQDPSGQTSLGAEADLAFDTEYRWRVRAEFEGEAGPWSAVSSFRTPSRVVLGTGDNVGPPRNIGFNEAYDILFTIYQAARWDISGRSNRDQLNLFLETAMAALHYGHGKWNPRGPDTGWCIKNGGPGRPQSDDVIARCDTRDAWDLVSGIGGSNPVWTPTYLGRLPGDQQIYAPRASTLALLPR
ncbi:MAG: fibronectin type III domain-containing protein [Acidobacteria bacterium]|nr:fibronectin type III domain-containing protein [Acidobacteriota bacterium]